MNQPSLKAVLGQAQAFFASKGLRFTKQREAVTTLIFRTHEHFRPEELCERLRKSDSSASRATIYRTILHLVESGMDPNLDIMQNCITRRMGFSPTEKALRIEGRCDMLRLLGTCKNLQASGRQGGRVRG